MAKNTTIEQELNKVTKVRKKLKEEKRAYLIRLIKAFDDITDEQWDTLSPEAQEWHNDAIRSWKKNQKPIDFPEVDEDEDQDDEDEKPVTKRKASKVSATKKKKLAVEPDEDDAEEDDEPAPKKKASSKKKKKVAAEPEDVDDADEVEEDDEPAPKKKVTSRKKKADVEPEQIAVGGPGKSLNIKDQIKEHLIVNESKPIDEIFDAMEKANPNVAISRSTITGIAAEFRHSLKFLRSKGLLKG